MNPQDDFDRTMRVWFEDGAPRTAPRHLFDAVVAETGARRPRAGWRARLAGISAPRGMARIDQTGRLLILIAISAALLVGMIAGLLLAGGTRPPFLAIGPYPTASATSTPAPTGIPVATLSATPAALPTASLPYCLTSERNCHGAPLTVSGGSLPTVTIPPGLDPRMSPGDVEQQVLAEIARNEQYLHQVLAPARVTAIRLMPPGSTYSATLSDGPNTWTAESLTWAVAAQGTILGCGNECDSFTSTVEFIADDGSGGGTDFNLGPATPIPFKSFLDYLAGRGQVFHWAAVPATGGAAGAGAALAEVRDTHPDGNHWGPIYGLLVCTDPTLGCQEQGTTVPGQTQAIWWVGFQTGQEWAAFDAATGAPIARSGELNRPPVALEDIVAHEPVAGGTYTSNRFSPRVTFKLQPGDWCPPFDGANGGPFLRTSARTILLSWTMSCVSQLWFIRPASVDCGTPTRHPDAAALAAAILANPGLAKARDLGTLRSNGAVPATLFLRSYEGRVVEVDTSRTFDPSATDPDHCRLLPEPGSGDPTFEVRGDIATKLILTDADGELLVVLVAPGGYDGYTPAPGHDGNTSEMFGSLLSTIYDVQFGP